MQASKQRWRDSEQILQTELKIKYEMQVGVFIRIHSLRE